MSTDNSYLTLDLPDKDNITHFLNRTHSNVTANWISQSRAA